METTKNATPSAEPHDEDKRWLASSHLRLGASLISIILACLVQPHSWPIELRVLVAWDAGAVCYLALAWQVLLTCDAKRTRQLSRRADDRRAVIDGLLVLTSFASIGGVLTALSKAEHLKGALKGGLTGAAIAAIVLSWLLMQTVYAFHYARLYYHECDGQGIDFHGDEPPDYLDFCYLSFAVGTTFGATDTEIGGRIIRRTIIKHGLLSFTFATVILALALSLVGDLLTK